MFHLADSEGGLPGIFESMLALPHGVRRGKIPRPLSATFHGLAPNDVMHFYCSYMGPSTDELEYVLLLKDDFSSYFWLVRCERACAVEKAKAISACIRTFTAMRT